MSRVLKLRIPTLPADPAVRAVVLVAAACVLVLAIAGGSIAGSYVLTLHQIAVNNTNMAAAHHQQQVTTAANQRRQEIGACRQFGGLVESIVQANDDTRHAVKASHSFGQLFSLAVQRYYAQTGCARFFTVAGG